MSNPVSLQESPEKKAAWLEDAQKRMPIGTRVRVVNADLDEYIGVTGTVRGYDLGFDGDWPIISVKFDNPVRRSSDGGTADGDGFYCDGAADDEIVKEVSDGL